MPTTLRRLLSTTPFRLSLVGSGARDVLDEPLAWAHSSDLPDPTPWLAPHGLLLTDGVQFLAPQSTDPTAYVARLRRVGVTALGFAVQTVHPAIPSPLVAECARQGMPLLSVAADTPFMAIIRAVSDAIAADERAALESALQALRSVARAALRPDGLAAILRELENHLQTWVILYDAAGEKIRRASQRPASAETEALVEEEARRILQRARPVGARIPVGDGAEATLQSIGQRGRLRGVLAVGMRANPSRPETDLLDSVVALASIGLEQSRALDDARRSLRSSILELFAVGATRAGESVLRRFTGGSPATPFRLIALSLEPRTSATTTVLASLEALAERSPQGLFFGELGNEIWVAATDQDLPALRAVVAASGLRAGASASTQWAEAASAIQDARAARAMTAEDGSLILFEDVAQERLIDRLHRSGGRAIAVTLLARLDGGPDPAATKELLRTWLSHNGAWEPAARALRLHRHTLKARVEEAGRELGLDLDTFGGRAELWSALQLADRPEAEAGRTG